MKKLSLLLIAFAIIICTFSSCATESDRIEATSIPVRNISIGELDPSRFKVIGNVTGTGTYLVNSKSTEQESYESGKMGILTGNEIDYFEQATGNDYYSNDDIVQWSNDPFQMALNKALYEMRTKASNLGAHFLTFPSYTVQITEDHVQVNVKAVAVMLLDNKGQSLTTY